MCWLEPVCDGRVVGDDGGGEAVDKECTIWRSGDRVRGRGEGRRGVELRWGELKSNRAEMGGRLCSVWAPRRSS